MLNSPPVTKLDYRPVVSLPHRHLRSLRPPAFDATAGIGQTWQRWPKIPEIRFAKNGTISIAYQVIGAGALDILTFSSAMLPIDSMDEEPSLARFHRRFASFGRLIRLDLRGHRIV